MRWSAIDEMTHIEESIEMGEFEMNTNDLSQKDREILLNAFRQFRANDDESDANYSNRDEIERKLQHGGELNEVDRHMLLVGVANEVPDQDVFNYFNQILEK